jgi:catalase (peroxidase I)
MFLQFHDSFTFDVKSKRGGANGSIRLETGRGENFGLARAVDALVPIQAESGLSWGDTVALAGAVAVRATGGPDIPVTLGRVTAKSQDPTGILPNLVETVEELRRRFGPRGFDDRDLVALSGAHSLGRASGGGAFVKENTKFKNEYVCVLALPFSPTHLFGSVESLLLFAYSTG